MILVGISFIQQKWREDAPLWKEMGTTFIQQKWLDDAPLQKEMHFHDVLHIQTVKEMQIIRLVLVIGVQHIIRLVFRSSYNRKLEQVVKKERRWALHFYHGFPQNTRVDYTDVIFAEKCSLFCKEKKRQMSSRAVYERNQTILVKKEF